MSKPAYQTTPFKTDRMPPGIPYIINNEAAERFSYYGMRAILVVFMTKHLMGSDGELDVMEPEMAIGWYHTFMGSVYFFPILGAILADTVLGKYRTIMSLSIVYCLGHLALALDETRLGLSVGLTLIAIGSGGIKPCVSAHVGDQFGSMNGHLLERVFAWFYFSINVGAFVSMMLTPKLLDWYGPHVAFGIPGLLMMVATWVFWLGRNKFVHIEPAGTGFVKEVFSEVGRRVIGRLFVVYLFIAVFWALYDQNGSSWVLQAESLHLDWMGITWEPASVQAVNSIFVLIFIPLFSYWLYPTINRFFPLTALRKIGIGMFVMVPSFLIIAWLESRIQAGFTPSVGWQVLAYVPLTAAEVMIYQTGLEYTYSQSPKTMKSFAMALYLLSISLGNFFTASINFLLNAFKAEDGTAFLSDVSYFLFYAGIMLTTAVLYVFVARYFKEQRFLQDEE